MKLHLLLLSIALCWAPLLAETTDKETDITTTSPTDTIVSSTIPTTVSTPSDKSTAPTSPITTETTPAVPTTTSTKAPTTLPTKTPTTTIVPTTTTTTTTTSAPPTPTPTTETPTNTTVTPTSTNPPSPTPTPAPTPKPPVTNNFVLKDGNVTCARLELNISAEIPYDEHNGTGSYQLTPHTNITMLPTSTCYGPNDTEVLHLLLEDKHRLDIVFNKNKDRVSLSLSLTYSQEEFPNATDHHAKYTVRSDKDLYEVPSTRSYLCKAKVQAKLSPAAENVTGAHPVVANLWDLRYMAHVNQTTEDYKQELECQEDTQMADIVPIAVGVALAGLVVLVVIAYTVSRRRTKQRGYQSV